MNDESDEVFEKAAELFAVLSKPILVHIISELCQGEKNAGQLLESIDMAEPNMQQDLSIMFIAGILGKRRQGAQIFCRISDESAVGVFRAVCTQVAIDSVVN